MDRALFALSLGLAAALALPNPAKSAPRCAPHAVIQHRLADLYGETRHAMGLSQDGVVIELYAAQTTGTWTLTVTLPNGITSLVQSGTAFQALALALQGKPA